MTDYGPMENIKMDELNDVVDDDVVVDYDIAETSFNELPVEDDGDEMIPSTTKVQRTEIADQYINEYFNKLNYNIDPIIERLIKTDLIVKTERSKQQLYYKLPRHQPYNGRHLRITNPSNSKPTSLKTLTRSIGGRYFVKEVLKLDLTTFKPIQSENINTDPDLLDVLEKTQAENQYQTITLSGYARDKQLNARDKPVGSLSPEDIGILRDYQNTLRSKNDIDGSKVIDDKIAQWDDLNPDYKYIKDELVLANKRLVELFADKSILDSKIGDLMKEKTESALSESRLNEIDREINKFEAERTRIDNQLRKYNDQVSEWVVKKAEMLPLKEVFDDPALKLKEKLRILFKRHGVTIVSLATSVGLIISNIAVALGIKPSINTTNKPIKKPELPSKPIKPELPSKPIKKPELPSKPELSNKPDNGLPKAYNIAKSAIKRVSEWLKTLAQKSALAIPGLIGSIVSFILEKAGTVVGYVSEYLWIALVGLTIYVFEYLKK